MASSDEPTSDRLSDRLDGWKAIAGYLDRNVRTVQRWERTERLPVRRHPHKSQASAWASRSELDHWLHQRSAGVSPGAADSADSKGEQAPPIETGSAHTPNGSGSRHSRPKWILGGAFLAAGFLAAVVVARGQQGLAALRTDTNNESVYSGFAAGQAFYDVRQYREAVTVLEDAIARDPQYGPAWVLLAKTYGRLGPGGDQRRALEVANRVRERAPSTAEAHIARALMARAQRNAETWRAEASRAIELDARAAEAYALLGDYYSGSVAFACNRDQDPELAERYYARATELRPSLTTALLNRADNLRLLGRHAECIDLLTQSMRRFSDGSASASRGRCRLMQGDLVGAAADIEPLRTDSKIPRFNAMTALGWLELKRGETDRGIRDLEAALVLTPNTVQSEFLVARVYADVGDVSRATTHLTRGLQNAPTCAALVARATRFGTDWRGPEVASVVAKYQTR
jgi:tetratricopeptide (TPR) repeat protein